MEEWKEYRLEDVCGLVPGFAFKSKDFGDYETKAIKIKDIQPPFIDFEGSDGVCLTGYNKDKLKKYLVKKGDFLLAMTGATIGKIGRYTYNIPAYLNQRVLKFEEKQGVDYDFIYYYLSTQHFQSYIINHIDSESAQPNISAKTIGKYPVFLPSFVTQNRIAALLKSFDDKIEVNKRLNDNFVVKLLVKLFIKWVFYTLINDNLNQQAKTLFKSWFIDFEPFRDGKFVESEMGWIPSGWQVKELGEVTEPQNTRVKDRTDVKVLSPVTTGELVLSEEYFSKQVFSESIAKYIIVKPFDFAYNPARVNIGSLGMNTFDFDGCVSPVYVVFRCEDNYQFFFDLFRQTDYFKEEVKTRAIGGVRQTLGYKDFSLIKVVYPPKDIVEKFNKIYSTLLSKKTKNDVEIARLGEIRDILLPKLLSGELKVSEMNM